MKDLAERVPILISVAIISAAVAMSCVLVLMNLHHDRVLYWTLRTIGGAGLLWTMVAACASYLLILIVGSIQLRGQAWPIWLFAPLGFAPLVYFGYVALGSIGPLWR